MTHYISFSNERELLAQRTENSSPVYLIVTKTSRPSGPLSTVDVNLEMAYVTGDMVYLLRQRITSYQTLGGEMLGHGVDNDRPRRLADEAYKAAKAYLEERGLSTIEAAISYPRDIQITNGIFSFLKMDKESDSIVRGKDA